METKDKSPSLILGSDGLSEMMHNSHGAFKESLYIYESALIQAHKQEHLALSVYSLGLGLGYNEWISLGYCLKHKLSLKLQTSESEQWLYTVLKQIVGLESADQSFQDVYKAMIQVIELVCEHYELKPKDMIQSAHKLLASSDWKLYGALTNESLALIEPVTVVFYDAFSKKMSPELWQEEFLTNFLLHTAAPEGCVFSTYACTGSLKRSLKQSGFHLIPRQGFEGKRESTLAIKQSP